MRFVIKALGCLVVLNVVFLILMIGVQSLDATKVQARLRKDVLNATLGPGNWVFGPYGQVMDMFTDCIALSAGTIPPDDTSALTRALEHRYVVAIKGGKIDPCGALTSHLRDERVAVQIEPYVRYWHGYDVYLRPMVRLGVPQTRVHYVNLILIVILCVGLIHASTQLIPMSVTASLLATLFLSTDLFTVPFVTAHAVGFMVCLATAWGAAVHLKLRPDDVSGLRWIAVFSGAVFAFVDFLVNPPLTPALLMFLVVAVTRWNRPGVSARSLLLSSSSIVLTWFASYATTWAGKWVISAVFFGPRTVIDEVFANIVRRTVGDPRSEVQSAMSVHIGTATLVNIETIGWALFALFLAVAGAMLVFMGARRRFSRERVRDFLIVALPALVPILWLELLRNHSIVHAWYVFRDLGMSLGIVVAAAMFVVHAGRRVPQVAPPARQTP